MTGRALRVAACAGASVVLAACVTVPAEQRAFVAVDGAISVQAIPCGSPAGAALPARTVAGGSSLDPEHLRVVSWNLHKGYDLGWQSDLARFAHASDLLLLQEAVLDDELRRIVDGTGFHWVLASAFERDGRDAGVLTAARARPLSACTRRAFETLFPIPKSTLVARYPLGDRGTTLAVANLHGVNFTLGVDAYRAQIDALVAELATHDGPVLLAGDFNTWSEARLAALHAAVAPLDVTAVEFAVDGRTRFVGQPVDHIFARGLEAIDSGVWQVRSSDHHPLFATFRVRGGAK